MLKALAPLAAALLLFAPLAHAEAPVVTIAADEPSYTSLEVAQGAAAVTVSVADGEGTPVAGALVLVRLVRDPWVTNVGREIAVSGTTGEDGTFTFVVPATAAAPGTYGMRAIYGNSVGTGSLVVNAA